MTQTKALSIAAAMLLVGVCRHYGWQLWPIEHRALASKALGGLALLSMIWLAVWLAKAVEAVPVALWWSFEELQVAGCSFGYMLHPWPVATGTSMCSAAVGYDIGAATLIIITILVYWLAGKAYR